jgi:hypothetical protein
MISVPDAFVPVRVLTALHTRVCILLPPCTHNNVLEEMISDITG